MTAPATVRRDGWRGRNGRAGQAVTQHNRIFFIVLAAPGILWLALLFIVPFYDVLAIGAGHLDLLTGRPIAVYNPAAWSTANLAGTWHTIFGVSAFLLPLIWRTIWYTAAAAVLCLLIGYPAAYFVARFAGRRKAL